jgi:hypothetical protein
MQRNWQTTQNVSRNDKYNKVQNPVAYITNCAVTEPKRLTPLIPKLTIEHDPEILPLVYHIYSLSP